MVDGGLLWSGKDPAVTQDRAETRDTEDKNERYDTRLPSNDWNNIRKIILSCVEGVF